MGPGGVFTCLGLLSPLLSPRALHSLSLSHAVFTAPLGKTEAEKVRESRNCCKHFRQNPSQIGAHLHLCRRFSMLNNDKAQVEVPLTHLCLYTARCFLPLCVARARSPVSVCIFQTWLLQVFISHPPLTRHPSLDLRVPFFHTEPLTPTYQSRVSAVITCVCIYRRSPHPVPKSRIRVQSGWETRSPPGFCSSSCCRADSLPDYNSFFPVFCHGK